MNALDLAAWKLASSRNNDCNQLRYTEWREISATAHHNIEFEWQGDMWICTNGVPIGLQYALEENKKLINENSAYYGAYIDDHFGISYTLPTNWLPALLPTTRQPNLRFDPPEFINLRQMVVEKKPFDILDVKFWAVSDIQNRIRLLSDVFTKPMPWVRTSIYTGLLRTIHRLKKPSQKARSSL